MPSPYYLGKMQAQFISQDWQRMSRGFKTLKLGLETQCINGEGGLGTHAFERSSTNTSLRQWTDDRTAFHPYVKGDHKYDSPLIESSHWPYGHI